MAQEKWRLRMLSNQYRWDVNDWEVTTTMGIVTVEYFDRFDANSQVKHINIEWNILEEWFDNKAYHVTLDSHTGFEQTFYPNIGDWFTAQSPTDQMNYLVEYINTLSL